MHERTPAAVVTSWVAQLAEMSGSWDDLVAPVGAWRSKASALIAEQHRITAAGHWRTAGPVDLLTIAGRGRRETIHCAILAWLFRPNESHGLEGRMLQVLLQAVGIDVPAADVATALVRTEETRGARRADIYVSLPGYTVIVEAKVDAPESPNQCLDTFRLFGDDEGARFVFLNPAGRPPDTAGEAIQAFKPLSFHVLRDALASALNDTNDLPPGAARATAASYLDTLKLQFPRRRAMTELSEKVCFFLEHQRHIEEWAALKVDAQAAADAFFRELAGPFSELAPTLGADVRVYPYLEGNHPKFFFIREGWLGPERKGAPACVAFEWNRKHVAFDTAFSGIWTNNTGKPDYVALHASLSRAVVDAGLRKSNGPSSWWPIQTYERPTGAEWWKHLPAFRDQLVETMRLRWTTLAPLIDQELALCADIETAPSRVNPAEPSVGAN
jgi:hypothetical protein